MKAPLHQEGKKESFTSLNSTHPSGCPDELEMKNVGSKDGVTIQIHILVNRTSTTTTILVFLIPLVMFLAVPFAPDLFSRNAFIFLGLFFLTLLSYLTWQDVSNKRVLTITPSRINIKNMQPQNDDNHRAVISLKLRQVENILIKDSPSGIARRHIVIIGKNGEISTGSGMSDSTLEWLQDYLRTTVIEA